jgi:hypothetical protein
VLKGQVILGVIFMDRFRRYIYNQKLMRRDIPASRLLVTLHHAARRAGAGRESERRQTLSYRRWGTANP